ncbi:lactate permease LctP family transporter [Escherichia coli]
MVTWTQMYMPMGGLGLSALVALIPIIFFFVALAMGGLGLSALVALIPIIFFFVALAVLRLKGHVAGAITLILSILIAIFAFKMPIDMAFAAAGYGFIYGLWPIAWIIVAAVFLYKLTVASGQFDIIRSSVISITDDQRLQVLLIGFSFGALLEGAAGFGAPVAITGALLVGLGFKPLYAAGLCLIANTAPVAFGALGVPILVAGQVTGIDPFHIGAMAGRQLPFLSVLVPFWLVAMMDGWKGVKETWPAALVAGGSFAVTQFFTSNYIGPELPDITSALVSIVSLALFLKVWRPKNTETAISMGQSSLALFLKVWRPKNTETAISMGQSAGAMVVNKPSSGGPVPSEYSLGQIIRAWSPFLILTVLVTIWTMKPFKALFAPGGAFYSLVINFQIPHLHQQVLKAAPIVAQPTPMDAVFKFDPLSAGGTAIFIAAIISIFILGVGIKKGIGVFAETLISLKWPILSIGMVLAFAFVTNYSGMSTTLALVLAGTGVMFPFFSPFLGWLGVFLTGSDTSSNALFGSLQSTTAQQINVSDTLLVAANTSGGVTGKMISPQSIAVACAATGMVGRESELFRYTVKHSLIFASVIGVITLLQAYVFTGMLVS